MSVEPVNPPGRTWTPRFEKDQGPAIGLDQPNAGPMSAEIIPPQAIAAEMCLLGSMILDRDIIADVVEVVDNENCFYVPQHRLLFTVLMELYNANSSIDLVILRDELQRRNIFDELGGIDFLTRLTDSIPASAHAPQYARTVKDKSLLRDLIHVAGQIQHEAYTTNRPSAEVLDEAERAMFEITHRRATSRAEHVQVLIDEAFQQLEQADGKFITGLPTGFVELDSKLCGLQRGEMIVIAARPSMGKTAFAMNIAEHIAADKNVPVAVFSLEMTKAAVGLRLLCSRAGVDSNKFRRGHVSDEDMGKLRQMGDELRTAPLYIDDTTGLTPMAFRAKCRRMAQRFGIQAIVLDYLQLMREPTAESRQIEITLISGAIKQVARELNVPVIALSQLNRGVEGRDGHEPRMSDLRESGAIEQDADVIMLLHREEYYRKDDESVKGKAQIIIAKQRNGPVGKIELQFNPVFTRFHNLANLAPDAGGY